LDVGDLTRGGLGSIQTVTRVPCSHCDEA